MASETPNREAMAGTAAAAAARGRWRGLSALVNGDLVLVGMFVREAVLTKKGCPLI